MKLLELHHRRLSELLKLPHEPTSQPSSLDGDIPEEDEKQLETEGDGTRPSSSSTTSKSENPSGPANAPSSLKPIPTLSHQRSSRYTGRDLSSSIASNLASARGIKASKYRGQPLSPSVSNDQAPGSLEVHPRKDASSKTRLSDAPDASRQPSWVPPAAPEKPDSPTSTVGIAAEPGSQSPSDEGFSRFYSTFGSLITRLSAPLAFAGLPLITEESASESEPAPVAVAETHPPRRQRPQKVPGTPGSAEPDLSKIYSKATLRALAKDGHAPTDSFYVVPTSGHTVSYANILSFDQKERRRMAASFHGADGGPLLEDPDEDDFVDARESQASLSPGIRKRPARTPSERELQNVVEELHLENRSLKEMLDKLSKRLHAFELNSQSSHLALAQSIRFGRPGSPLSSSGGGSGGGGDTKPPVAAAAAVAAEEAALRKKNQALEEQLTEAMKNLASLEKEYEKTLATVDKYRDRWEKLKAGAKARRDAQVSGDGGESSRPPP